ncbi:MAG: tRNA (adenosine(37)-N6)-threonylcarbamoyltransferase complex ATPase subunit type 1 TsaE [Muribaculaceae bacterium]|nr:tRNA (adenosine(37)-N6)-threonylcarbamoyltransferase complex ATPase subunit type 1 TsaE [Muribaculaceae bacterium]
MKIHIKSLDGIDAAAREFLDAVEGRKVIAFYGEMGVGKTTFINALSRQLGVTDDAVNSPSFSIVNEYETASGDIVYHFDLYRLDSIDEALAIGIEDYFYSGRLCLIEWPERIEPLLPDDALIVLFTLLDDGSRQLTFKLKL